MDAQERNELVEIIRKVVRTEVQTALQPYATRDEVQTLIDTRVPPIIRAEIQLALQPYPTRDETQAMIDTAYDRLAAATLTMFDDIKQRFAALEKRVDTLDGRLSGITRRLDNIDSNISDQRQVTYRVQTELEIMRERLSELEERIVQLEANQNG